MFNSQYPFIGFTNSLSSMIMFDSYRPFIVVGLAFILVGLVLLFFPLIPKLGPILERLEKLPPILIYVYRRDNFYFVTSPILIIVTVAYLLWTILKT